MGDSMDKSLLQNYTLRISQASKSELVVIMYDVILTDIDSSIKAFKIENYNEFEYELKHACRFLNELMATLDYSVSLSYDLLSLYSYTNKSLIKAYIGRTCAPLDGALMVINRLRDAFAQISAEDTSGPVMKNVQQVYAGLTYGKGTLNESLLDPAQENRGFKA